MTPTEKSYYREIARLALQVSIPAEILSRDSNEDDERLARVQATLDNAITKFQTFLAETTR